LRGGHLAAPPTARHIAARTLNHLARDAGIPAGLEEAAAIIAAGHVREIDLAEVNGRVFVNNSSVAFIPTWSVCVKPSRPAKAGAKGWRCCPRA